jgi:type IV pilus assembly protein PilV
MKPRLPARPLPSRTLRGSVLLEALFGILIFSMGVLGLVGLQTSAMKQSIEGKYRTDASLLANQLIGQMWVSDRTSATLISNFQTGGTAYNSWLSDVSSTLPGVADGPPTVVITPVAGGSGATVNSEAVITISWKTPSETASTARHVYKIVTQIK